MNYMDMLPEQRLICAIELSTRAHTGQLDKAGVPYIYHPLAVAKAVAYYGINAMCAAVLHDVIEDHPKYRGEVVEFGPEIYGAVEILTRKEGESYTTYVNRIAKSCNRTALVVKIADLAHNLSPDRCKLSSSHVKRYTGARMQLMQALGQLD